VCIDVCSSHVFVSFLNPFILHIVAHTVSLNFNIFTQVLLYSPYSSVPLSSHTLPAKASSLVFCPATSSSTSSSTASTESGEGTGRGIAVATESCEMLFLTVGGANGRVAGTKGRAAQVAAKVGEQTATVSVRVYFSILL